MSTRTLPAGLINKVFQRVVTNSTATLLNSTAQGASALYLSVEVKGIRFTLDGSTAPTANTGVLLNTTNSPYFLEGIDGTKFKLARAAAGAIVNVQAFTRA